MSNQPEAPSANRSGEQPFELRLKKAAKGLIYPADPPLNGAVIAGMAARRGRPGRRGCVIVGVLLALLLLAGFAVPTVRAAVLTWIRIGAVQIYLVQPSPTPTSTQMPGTIVPVITMTPLPVPLPSPTVLSSVLDLSGETTLGDADSKAGFSILLPTYPYDLGQPDHVYLQDLGGPEVILVWMDRIDPQKVRLALYEVLANNIVLKKMVPQTVLKTKVNGKPAIWIEGQYILISGSGNTVVRRLVEGHTLIWTVGKITYRLESGLDLAACVRIAESLN
ncbi:MAG: hypothetical protein P4L50_07435 [Anaerolineaceae bacterium]|nr:hypothetical protein [Anaerolineaceae bacterium]